MAKSSNDGCGTFLALGAVIWVITVIPKPVWITIGVIAVLLLVVWIGKKVADEAEKSRAAAAERARADQIARAALRKQQLIDSVGAPNAKRVERAEAATLAIAGTEAAREGWLGDIDFRPDISAITVQFQRSHELQQVANQLSALDNASVDDRKLLAEARTTIATLEGAALERIELIAKCEREAGNIDASLRQERKDAQTAEQRAELHAKLSAMIYGIEATPDVTATSSAADSVMARVQAFREIKNQIQLIRDSEPRP